MGSYDFAKGRISNWADIYRARPAFLANANLSAVQKMYAKLVSSLSFGV
jgi:hypothetical protein